MQFVNDNVIPMILEENQLPRQSHIENFLKRATPSAPGPDGIPYSAWKASCTAGSIVLHKALRAMMNGPPPSPHTHPKMASILLSEYFSRKAHATTAHSTV